MSTDDFTYKAQDVNYLGFLEAQLRDMQGIHTLAYELIQNADDVPDSTTTHLTFDITDEALLVSNNGVFRDEDFTRLQSIASGGKREEVGTTGAFGLGFIAVYQVTDAPEIFSNGRHWRITPQAPAEQRIQERPAQTSGTLFRLPWAFDPASIVRRTLRQTAVQPSQLDEFAQQIATAIELGAVFLKQLQQLEVKRNGNLIQRIERENQDNQLIFRKSSQTPTSILPHGGRRSESPSLRKGLGEGKPTSTKYLLLTGDFATTANQLRDQYPWQIEAKRHSQVQLALPLNQAPGNGRLYATLPTETTTPLPLHINADFFPTTDRKRIHFDDGYQAEWNQAAITCAAQILATHFDELPSQLGHVHFWHLLQKTADCHQAAQQNELPAIFSTFWQTLTPLLSQKPIVYVASGKWQMASEVRLAGRKTAIDLLQALHIPSPHPDLLPHIALLRRAPIAVPDLSIADIAVALANMELKRGQLLRETSAYWQDLAAWQGLWQTIDSLLNYLPPRDREAALQRLRPLPLILSQNMSLEPLSHSYRGQAEARALFPQVAWAHDSIDSDSFPGRYLPKFGVRAAVEWLQERPLDQLEQEWRLGWLDVPRLWQWLERQQIEISDDPDLAQAIRQLPLCPVGGDLRPLAHLYLPGDFTDPLNLAGVIDVAALGGHRQLLRDLGARELNFDSYLHDHLPHALQQHPDIPSDARHRLLQLLAARLGKIQDDAALQNQLSQLPLIACFDGSFRPANQVYASREVLDILGDGTHIAEPVESQALAALHSWLGVRERPSAPDIVQALLTRPEGFNTPQTAISPNQNPSGLPQRMWQRLKELYDQGQVTAETLSPLQGQSVIPNRRQKLCRADQLFWVDQPDLAARFEGLADHLLLEADWVELTAVLGTRPLSQVVKLVLVGEETAVNDPATQAHIINRQPLIERLLQAEDLTAPDSFFDKLRVTQHPQPHIQYRLQIGTKWLTSNPEPITVKLLDEQLVLAEGVWSWTAVARELALAFKGNRAIGGLALGLKEVLMAVSFAEAQQILDELGVG